MSRAPAVVGWFFVIVALGLALGPNGALGQRIVAMKQSHDVKTSVRAQWNALTPQSSTIGEDVKPPALVVFSDYRCAYCRILADSISKHLAVSPSRTLALRSLFRPGDSASEYGARAFLCTDEIRARTLLHLRLLTDSNWIRRAFVDSVRREVAQASFASYHGCLFADSTNRRLSMDSAQAVALHVRATPAFAAKSFGVHQGIVDLTQLERWSNHEQ